MANLLAVTVVATTRLRGVCLGLGLLGLGLGLALRGRFGFRFGLCRRMN